MIDTLQQANFEKVELDSRGEFSFKQALNKLKRSMVGIHNKIFPVYIMGSVVDKNGVLETHQVTTTSTNLTFYTTSATKRTFLTGYHISATWSSLANTATSFISIVPLLSPAGGTFDIGHIVKQPLIGTQFFDGEMFDPAIELAPNSIVTLTNAFSAGASTYVVTLYGYESD